MKYLHIMHESKFVSDYINLIFEKFIFEEHYFIILSRNKNKKIPFIEKDNVQIIENSFLDLLKILSIKSNIAKKIIIHGLFEYKIIVFLLLQFWLLKKSYWVLWGGDLYFYENRKKTIKHNIYEFFRKKVIKNIHGIITYIEGDFNLAKEWYDTKAELYKCLYYPSVIPNYSINNNKNNNKNNQNKFILIGNSASPTNNHKSILNKIRKTNLDNTKLICPLSYGDMSYAKSIKKYGKELFGDKFISLDSFLTINAYNKLLKNIDIAIFNHKRQQAMGNILTLLYLGKKVYIRDDIVTWEFFRQNNIKVYSINNSSPKELLKDIDVKHSKSNSKVIKNKFTEERFVNDWNKIFMD